MTCIRSACELNNRGVSLLVAGELQVAMMSFQDALATIKHAVNDTQDEDYEQLGHASDSTTTKRPGTPHPTAWIDDEEEEEEELEQRCEFSIRECPASVPIKSVGQQGYVYDRPLLLGAPSSNDDVETLLSLYSAVILFNLALACHWMGRHRGREPAARRALVLYRMSMQLLMSCAQVGTMPVVLALLALNNRANIHYEYCDYQQTATCLQEMSKILTDDEFLCSSLPETDVEGLLLNVILLETPTAAKAA